MLDGLVLGFSKYIESKVVYLFIVVGRDVIKWSIEDVPSFFRSYSYRQPARIYFISSPGHKPDLGSKSS